MKASKCCPGLTAKVAYVYLIQLLKDKAVPVKKNILQFAFGILVLIAVSGILQRASAQNLTLRIVCYNIEDDITNQFFPTNTWTTPLPGLIFPYSGGTNTTGS